MQLVKNTSLTLKSERGAERDLPSRSILGQGPEKCSGISVIIPSYMGIDTLAQCVQSLRNQTLRHDLYEVVVILNGPSDGSELLLAEIAQENPGLNLRWFWNSERGAGSARNLGIALSGRSHLTFVDADDYVQPAFLESLWSVADAESIVIAPICNLDLEGEFDFETSLTKRIESRRGSSALVREIPWILGFNACKLIPRHLMDDVSYDNSLSSGEDLVYFAHLLRHREVTAHFPAEFTNNYYVRRLSEHSISRQVESFDFNVRQRIECVCSLRDIQVPEVNRAAVSALEGAQLGFVARYFADRPDQIDALSRLLVEKDFLDFPWSVVYLSPPTDLVFSYCFPPFSDTSAIVAAKVVAERASRADVISANLEGVRNRDSSLSLVASRWIASHTEIDCPPSFSDWNSISRFAQLAFEAAEEKQGKNGADYKSVYSRALWVGSHVAALLFKLRFPAVRWSAEFSDPLRYGVDGSKRSGELTSNDISKRLLSAINESVPSSLEVETLFDLVEYATMTVADELIFTNPNQLEFMLLDYPKDLQLKIRAKAVVRPHPSPSPELYHLARCRYRFPQGVLNLAYFGSFYRNRGLSDIFTALMNLPARSRGKIKLHVFTNNASELEEQIFVLGLHDVVCVNEYLPYFEFLNATTKVDVLLVNDTAGTFEGGRNPFLPSKYSDYKNAPAKIWGLVSEGSPLSQLDIHYKSNIGGGAQILRDLEKIINDWHEGQSPSE